MWYFTFFIPRFRVVFLYLHTSFWCKNRYEKLTENIVAQMLRTAGNELFFYSNVSRVAEDRMEIDFLVRKPSVTDRHNISPVEVKSSSRYSLTSLEKFTNKYGKYLATPFVLHTGDLAEKDGVIYLPLYMAGEL